MVNSSARIFCFFRTKITPASIANMAPIPLAKLSKNTINNTKIIGVIMDLSLKFSIVVINY